MTPSPKGRKKPTELDSKLEDLQGLLESRIPGDNPCGPVGCHPTCDGVRAIKEARRVLKAARRDRELISAIEEYHPGFIAAIRQSREK